MDTQVKYKTLEEIKMRAQLALKEIKRIDPDVVIIYDDNAFEHVALDLLKSKYPIVFGGMNLRPEYYDEKVDFMISRERPGYNITGVTEQTLSAASCKLLKLIYPQAKKMIAISSSSYPFMEQMAKDFESDFKEHPEKYPIKLEKLYLTDSWEEYQRLTLWANQREDIDVVYHLMCVGLYDKNGRGIPPVEAVNWILRNQIKPEYSPWMNWVEWGFLCGAGADTIRLGSRIGVQVHRVLLGEEPADIPIESPEDFYISLNLARAQQLGIKIPFTILGSAKVIHTKMTAFPEYQFKLNRLEE